MSHEASRRKPKKENSADRGQFLLALLIGLALIATVIMLLADSDGAQKLALLAALWAAIIGFFLLYRDRKQIEAARQEFAASEAVHQVELEKAHSDQQAEKFRLQKQHQEELRLKDNEILKEIRQQLEEMRTQLSELSGREWVYEPAVVQAEARRIIELETQQNQLEATETQRIAVPVAPEHVEPVPTPDWSEKAEVPQDVVDIQVEQPVPELTPEPVVEEPEAQPRRARHSAPSASEGGGRRRRDERRGGVSVADLLATARKKEQD